MPELELTDILKEKKEALEKIAVDEWFEPVFKIIDRAVFGDEKVLVHCQAGQSRSATVLAAYFINRFNVSAMDAAEYLRDKRPCAAPKFIKQLEEYAQKLADVRAK